MGIYPAETKSSKGDDSPLEDFALLAVSAVAAQGARIELLDGRWVQTGSLDGPSSIAVAILVAGRPVGKLLIAAPGGPLPAIEPLLRRLAHYLEGEEALAFAEHANDLAASASRRFEALFDGVPIACYSTDADGRLMEWNGTAEARWPIAAAWGEDAASIVRPEDPASERARLERALGGELVREENGSAIPLRDAGGAIVGAIVTTS